MEPDIMSDDSSSLQAVTLAPKSTQRKRQYAVVGISLLLLPLIIFAGLRLSPTFASQQLTCSSSQSSNTQSGSTQSNNGQPLAFGQSQSRQSAASTPVTDQSVHILTPVAQAPQPTPTNTPSATPASTTDVQATATAVIANAQATAAAIITNTPVANATPTDTPNATTTTTATSTNTPTATTTSVATTGQVSPYLFGTNLGFFNAQDQVLTSTTTQALLQQMHMRMIRIPVRSTNSTSVFTQMMQTVKCIGATPLVILRGSRDATALADDLAVVQAVNQVFGSQTVYYEFGNEDDLGGSNVTTYTAAWNAVIPQVQKVALHGQFIGPVNFQYNHAYLQGFLQNAHPLPNEVSWHEYTCSYKWAADLCLSHLNNWNTHLQDARAVIQSTAGTALPIMITEWNYAPDQTLQGNGQPFSDGKWNNAAFMTAWTTKAFQILIANHVFASMQYSVTDTALPLIDKSNTVTSQGQVFQSLYTANQAQLSAPPA